MRSSLSCARRRRLRCLPSPAASSIRRRRSRGLEWTIASTRPCETTECISLPSPVSESTSSTSTSRQRAPFSRYSPSPSRSSRRDDRDLGEVGRRAAPSELSITTSTSAALRDGTPWPPAKITSFIVWPRTASGRLLAERPQHGVGDVRLAGAVRPDDHGHARARTRAWCGREGLEALHGDRAQVHGYPAVSAIDGRAPAVRPPARRSSWSFPRRGRSPPRRPRPPPRSCGRAAGPPRTSIRYTTTSARRASRSWSTRLVVHRVLERLLDLLRERRHHRGRHALEAEREVGGADHRLADRGEHAVGVDQHLGAACRCPRARRRAAARGTPRSRATWAHDWRDTAWARTLVSRPAPWLREAREEIGRDDEAQDHVPQERESLVRVRSAARPTTRA